MSNEPIMQRHNVTPRNYSKKAVLYRRQNRVMPL